uniref:Uncharacterized protein n=1 Tax=Zea mays TaxID=4577 RepID=A0A804RGA8_MAIZE
MDMGVGYCGGGGAECSSSSVATGATEEKQLLKGEMAVNPLCEQPVAAHVERERSTGRMKDKLVTFDLCNNKLHGPIPDEIGNMASHHFRNWWDTSIISVVHCLVHLAS